MIQNDIKIWFCIIYELTSIANSDFFLKHQWCEWLKIIHFELALYLVNFVSKFVWYAAFWLKLYHHNTLNSCDIWFCETKWISCIYIKETQINDHVNHKWNKKDA